ncbi:hypothetical protein NDU88_002656 [Pleurodeles waltl]|uniref:Uncharacterized protein n=1 Tax=Pleurodeles waltl TaxID=8319 RepID=A0AAV7UAE9_PLEWA|nr:hypothetical protein NDU88_002656 [Pleurodeles waltl]
MDPAEARKTTVTGMASFLGLDPVRTLRSRCFRHYEYYSPTVMQCDLPQLTDQGTKEETADSREARGKRGLEGEGQDKKETKEDEQKEGVNKDGSYEEKK